MIRLVFASVLLLCLAANALAQPSSPSAVTGWLSWRGPHQCGRSDEGSLPESVAPERALWSIPMSGRGAPVIAGDRLYAMAYEGEGPELQERLVCLEAATGKLVWEHRFNDFLSDIIYKRYAIGSPVVDAETGQVYGLTSAGELVAVAPDGKKLWQHSLMEEVGRLTFPNGRTGGPIIDGDLVIVHSITANWGEQGPPRDRLYAYDKRTGAPVWASTPGEQPSDNSYGTPVFAWLKGRRVFYVGTGCGNVACVDARTGEPLSRINIASGGINSSVVRRDDGTIIAIQGVENPDDTGTGRMVALTMDQLPAPGVKGPVVLPPTAEKWRLPLCHFSSSPVLVGDRVYQMSQTGELTAVDTTAGTVLWKLKLAPFASHASPLFADGRVYMPLDTGGFAVVQISATAGKLLETAKLAGSCLGSPVAWNGRLYLLTTERLYCWGSKDGGKPPAPPAPEPIPAAGPATRLQLIPNELLLQPGQEAQVAARALDANGAVAQADLKDLKWEKFVPPTAKVRAFLEAEFIAPDRIKAGAPLKPSAGAFKATAGKLAGTLRGRVLPGLPFAQDFESFALEVPHEKEAGVKFAYPPLPWIGARFKWEIRDLNGNKVLAKTLDTPILQRAFTFFGPPDLAGYTLEADVMSDGNRRMMSTVGLINQRYLIMLDGNWQRLEVNSNQERLREFAPFPWKPNVWYHLKTRVDTAADGTGTVRAKAWVRGEPEPAAWTIEVKVKNAHTQGSPGVYGFAPQNLKRVYVDNISLVKSEAGK